MGCDSRFTEAHLTADLSVVVIGRDRLARAGLASVLESEGFTVIGVHSLDAARSGPSIWEDMRPHASGPAGRRSSLDKTFPDVVILDAGWSADDVWTFLKDVAQEYATLVLVAEAQSAPAAWTAGAAGVLPRDVTAATLAAAARSLAAGLAVADRDMLPGRAADPALLPDNVEPLTERERDVLRLVAAGLSNREIGTELVISENTVKYHVNAILSKLNARTRTEAAVRGARLGYVVI
jgi:DNA-binding NarL/FixJ family response regulator